MKKEDGPYLKLPLRGVLTALQVTDSLQEWRTDLLLRTVVAEMTVSLLYTPFFIILGLISVCGCHRDINLDAVKVC